MTSFNMAVLVIHLTAQFFYRDRNDKYILEFSFYKHSRYCGYLIDMICMDIHVDNYPQNVEYQNTEYDFQDTPLRKLKSKV